MGQVVLSGSIVLSIGWAVTSASGRLVAARTLAVLAAAVTSLSVMLLAVDLAQVDEGSRYVQRFTSLDTPLRYRLAGVWGGMEGSLLFWSWLVVVVTLAAGWRRRSNDPGDTCWIWSIGAAQAAGFLVITRLSASPFESIDVPTGAGLGLPAVLQNPAMLYHPPLLYSGLVLLTVPYALTMRAVACGRLDRRRWVDVVTPWLRTAWLVLGAGVVAGSHWAYAELGWGGVWAWDPVENASLIPWLLVTVAVHSLSVVARTGRTAATAAGAIAAAFVTMLFGVYVTRSGGSGSIHSFAESAAVGRAVLAMVAITVVASGVVLARLRPTSWRWRPWGREAAIGGHVGVVSLAALAIAVATFGPVVADLLGGRRSVVRSEFYDRVLTPLTVIALFGMAVGPSLRWAGGVRRVGAMASGAGVAAVGALVAIGLGTLAGGSSRAHVVVVVAGATVGALIGDALVRRPTSRSLGVALAHAGFAIVILGAAASRSGSTTQLTVRVGEGVTIGAETVEVVDLDVGRADRYEYVVAVVVLGNGDEYRPQLRAYDRQRLPTAEAAFGGPILSDTIVVMTSVGDDLTTASFDVLRRPLLPVVWWGSIVMLAGGACVAISTRRRAGRIAPDGVRCRSATATPPPAAATSAASTTTTQATDLPPPAPDRR